MATLTERTSKSGTVTYEIKWTQGGRSGSYESETFSDRRWALRFQTEVEAAGNRWPDGLVRGYGYGSPPDRPTSTDFEAYGLAYVAQIVELTPGQRSRYQSQIRALAAVTVLEAPCFLTIEDTTEADVKRWLIHWPRAIKTKANYHRLLFGVFQHAVEAGLIVINPCSRTAPTRKAIRAKAPDHVYLTEPELETLLAAANEDVRDLITVAVGTGLRFGELTALWVDDIDLAHGVLHVNKAWKDDGADGEQEIPTGPCAAGRSSASPRGPKATRCGHTDDERTVAFLLRSHRVRLQKGVCSDSGWTFNRFVGFTADNRIAGTSSSAGCSKRRVMQPVLHCNRGLGA